MKLLYRFLIFFIIIGFTTPAFAKMYAYSQFQTGMTTIKSGGQYSSGFSFDIDSDGDKDDYFFFSANSATSTKNVLWRTAGSTSDAQEIWPDSSQSPDYDSYGPEYLTPVGDFLFFVATDSDNVTKELWRSDGEAANTGKLTVPGPYTNLSFLVAYDKGDDGYGTDDVLVYVQDNTKIMTYILATGAYTEITDLGANIIYMALAKKNDTEKYIMAVTSNNTIHCITLNSTATGFDFNPSFATGQTINTNYESFAFMDETLLFTISDGPGGQVWKCDGVTAGLGASAIESTVNVPDSLVVVDTQFDSTGKKLFYASNKSGNWGLWMSDGSTLNGATEVAPNISTDANPEISVYKVTDKVVFGVKSSSFFTSYIIDYDGTNLKRLYVDLGIDGSDSTELAALNEAYSYIGEYAGRAFFTDVDSTDLSMLSQIFTISVYPGPYGTIYYEKSDGTQYYGSASFYYGDSDLDKITYYVTPHDSYELMEVWIDGISSGSLNLSDPTYSGITVHNNLNGSGQWKAEFTKISEGYTIGIDCDIADDTESCFISVSKPRFGVFDFFKR